MKSSQITTRIWRLSFALILTFGWTLQASESLPWSIQIDSARLQLQILRQDDLLIRQVLFRAVKPDKTVAFETQAVISAASPKQENHYSTQLIGSDAESSQVDWESRIMQKGVVLKLHIQSDAKLQYQRWLSGIHLDFSSRIETADAEGIEHWVDQKDVKSQLAGDMPYRDVAAQVRTITLKDKGKIALATSWFDAGWDNWDASTRVKRADNCPFSPGSGTVDKSLHIGVFDAQLPAWMIASALQEDKIAASITSDHVANLFEPHEPISMTMHIGNPQDQKQIADVQFDIYDYNGKPLYHVRKKLPLTPWQSVSFPTAIPGQDTGMLFVAGRVGVGQWSKPIWATIGILPQRQRSPVDQSSPFGLAHLFKGQADKATIVALGQRIGTRWWRRFAMPKLNLTDQDIVRLRQELNLFRNNGLAVQMQFQEPYDIPANKLTDSYTRIASLALEYGNYFCPGNEMNPRPVGKNKVTPTQLADVGKKHAQELQQPFHTATKAASSKALVTTQAMGGIPADYVRGFGEAGGFKWIDALNFHPYFFPHSPEYAGKGYYNLGRHLGVAFDGCEQFGQREWIISEVGYATVINPLRGVSLRTHADYLIRSHALMLAAGCRLIEWYTLQNGRAVEACPDPFTEQSNFGLLYTDLSPKPAYLAYGVMTAQLDGLKVLGRYDLGDPEFYAIGFGKADQPEVFILWSFKEKDERDIGKPRKVMMPWRDRYAKRFPVTLPTSGKVTITDIMGRVTTHDQSTIRLQLTGSPIYVRNLALNQTIALGLMKEGQIK